MLGILRNRDVGDDLNVIEFAPHLRQIRGFFDFAPRSPKDTFTNSITQTDSG